MKFESRSQLIKFIFAIVIAILLVIFGVYIISLTDKDLNSTQFFIIGSISILAGVFMASSTGNNSRWLPSLILIVLGFYQFARASGVIKVAWLAYIVGFACLVAAGLVLYANRPKKIKES